VAAVHERRCEIALIPHTLAATTAGEYAPGRRVNIEVDVLARYVARLMDEAGTEGRSS
jgi:riboflavin synthase